MNTNEKDTCANRCQRKPRSSSISVTNCKLIGAERQEAVVERYIWISIAVLVAALIAGQLWT